MDEEYCDLAFQLLPLTCYLPFHSFRNRLLFSSSSREDGLPQQYIWRRELLSVIHQSLKSIQKLVSPMQRYCVFVSEPSWQLMRGFAIKSLSVTARLGRSAQNKRSFQETTTDQTSVEQFAYTEKQLLTS